MATFRLRYNIPFGEKRSFCDSCGKILGGKDLIPLFSFFFSRGKSRCCQKFLDPWYPWVEFSLGVLFVLVVVGRGELTTILFGWIFMSFLMFIFIFDTRYYLVHFGVMSIGFILFGFLHVLLWTPFLSLFFGVVLGGGFYFVQHILGKGKWVGGGDIILGLFLGFVLGYEKLIVTLFFAYLIGGIFGSFLLLQKKKTLKSRLPMGAFLAIGGLLSFFWGDRIIEYYMNLL